MGGRDPEPLQNGADDALFEVSVPPGSLHAAGGAEGRPVDLLVVADEAQVRQKVFPGDQHQLLPLAAGYPVRDLFFPAGKVGLKAPVDHVHGLVRQISDGLIMQVEGGPVHSGPAAYLLHGDILQVLLLQQRNERLVHPQGGVEVFAF